MFKKINKKPLKQRLRDTAFLLKNSFTIIGREEDIKTPAFHIIIFSIIITALIFCSILTFLIGKFVLIGIAILVFTIFILAPFKVFYSVRQKADISWLVYNALSGRDISYADAHNHTKNNKSQLRSIAFIGILIKILNSGGEQEGSRGIKKILITLFLGALEEVWDLLGHYMIPSVVIEQKPLKEIAPEIKALKNNVPATLMGVFGIDFAGNVVKALFIFIYILFFIISLGIGHLIALYTPNTVITLGNFSFSWMPVFIILFVMFTIGNIFNELVDIVKVIYFTIFYTSIKRPMDIVPTIRNQITNYLLMKKSDFASQQGYSQEEQYINQLADYIKQFKNSGYSEQQIAQYLLSEGYSQEDINSAIQKIRE